jgi:hypothetical protein
MAKNVQDELDRMAPAARDAALGDVLNDLITQHNALLAHLDAANVTGIGNTNTTNYSVTPLQQRLKSAT